ncbi:MAG: TrkA family potassium uptake protein [Clostridia bacterium]|nr:TrkA family potassium uptake protein [Clostridia bacterium]
MSINKSYAVFGLGRYGLAVAKELVKNGADVLAVDIDENIVNSAAADIPFCKCADVTDPDVIRQLGISNVDVAIIAMASNLEANVMTIMLCKEAGVNTVIAKCADDMQGKILSKVGADKVVLPERESGTRLAKNILSSGFVDVVELSDDVSVVELDVKNEWIGKDLIELNLRKKYGINIIAIKTDDRVQIDFDPTMKLTGQMNLVVIAHTSKIEKLK